MPWGIVVKRSRYGRVNEFARHHIEIDGGVGALPEGGKRDGTALRTLSEV